TLLFTQLGDASGALAHLEQVLRERPSATQARHLVEKILDVPELRARAAIILEAVYATRDEVPELVRVLEIHLEFARRLGAHERAAGVLTTTAAAATAPVPRSDILMDVARLCESELNDAARA